MIIGNFKIKGPFSAKQQEIPSIRRHLHEKINSYVNNQFQTTKNGEKPFSSTADSKNAVRSSNEADKFSKSAIQS